MRPVRPGGSGRRRHRVRRRAVRGDDAAVREDFAGVLEEQDPVAQQTPALLRVVGHRQGGVPVGGEGGGAGWLVLAHGSGLSLARGARPAREAGGFLDGHDRIPRIGCWSQVFPREAAAAGISRERASSDKDASPVRAVR
ncbi:hypothetical protein STTU_5967 [Streptomyces sp. Tu6071]|nr:hypothetical protein STTU_5967 [Streptomyces sp. Tu6071]